MTLYKTKLVIITLILFIAGCREKDELTLPVKVSLNIGFFSGGDGDPFDTYVYFTEGQIGIQKIQFEGRREAGRDVFFETDPNINLSTFEFNLNYS